MLDEFARQIVETVPDVMLILDEKLRVQVANRSFYQTFEVSSEATNGRFIYDLGNGEWNIPELRHVLEDILPQNKTVESFEVEHDFPDIGMRVMLLNAREVHQHEAGGSFILLVISDITERRKIERALATQVLEPARFNEFARQIVESSNDAIIGKAPDGMILSWNRGAEQLYGYSPEEAIGQAIQMLTTPEQTDEIPALLEKIQHGGHIAQYETVRVTKAGKRVDISLAIAPIQTLDGVIIGAATIARNITARKQSERELIASEQRFRSVFENAPISLWELDLSGAKQYLDELKLQGIAHVAVYFSEHPEALMQGVGRIRLLDVNPATVALFHAPDKAAVLDQFPGFLGEGAHSFGRTIFAAIATVKPSYRGEPTHYRTFDGKLIDVDLHWSIVAGYEATYTKVIIAVVDITERLRAERALQQYSQRIEILHKIDSAILAAQSPEQIAQGVVTVLFVLLPCNTVRVVSIDAQDHSITQLAAYPVDTEEHALDLRQTAGADDGIREILQQGETFRFDDLQTLTTLPRQVAIMLGQDGGRSGMIVPLIIEGQLVGRLDSISSEPFAFSPAHHEIAREVGDQLAIALHKSELDEQIREHARVLEARVIERTEQLRSAKERSEAILLGTSDAMFVANPDGSIEQVNPAFTSLFGYTPEAGRSGSLFALVDSVSMESLQQSFNEVAGGRSKTKRAELVCKRWDGTIFDADAAFAQFESNGTIPLICSVRDISVRKQTEENLRLALAKEHELGELKTRFVATVSYEFRTPLTSILSSSDLIKNYANRMSTEKRGEHLDRIAMQVKHLTDLLEDVLFMSRADSMGVQLNLTMTDVAAFCWSLVDEMQLSTPKRKIQFISNVRGLMLQFDPKLMRQVVTNLLSNAIKYSPPDTTVHMNLTRDETSVTVRVADEGIGIPQEDQKHLFELFHRACNVGTTPGTGLGLTIIKQAVEAHGGTVTVDSQLNVGTAFTISIPLSHQSFTDILTV